VNLLKLKIYICLFVLFSCSEDSPSSSNNNIDGNGNTNLNSDIIPHKEYSLDSFGNILDTEIMIEDFDSAATCKNCHEEIYNQWASSFHALSFNDPIFMSMWSSEKNSHPETGTMYCVQCHAPAAFVTGYSLEGINSQSDLKHSDIPNIIKEGVSCDICHTMVQKSPTVHTQDNIAAVAEYFLNPGEDIKYGSIQDPDCSANEESGAHSDCQYLPLFKSSSSCKPCHDQTIRGMPIETTVSQWDEHPPLAMFGPSCQDCHMPKIGSHSSHYFAGVDLLFYDGVDESSDQYQQVINLLEQSATIHLGYFDTVKDSIYIEDNILYLPITVNNLTGHRLPSGTPFSREAWVEIKVFDSEGNIIFDKGALENPYDIINHDDPDIILYTTILYDQENLEGNIVYEPSKALSYDDRTLRTLFYDSHQYQIEIENSLSGLITVKARMLFRSFKPQILNEFHPSSINNLPVIEICSDSVSVMIP
tara:strand:+ start:12202 stop:13629 length:1428 start_codon:yes stop_codon:yes gene_type:complete